MKHLSLLTALMLSSSMVYAGWTRYEFDPATGVYKTAPKYSCLEMICEHDCVENSETGEGECCPVPILTSCQAEQLDEFGCPLCKCLDGFELWQGKCIEKCDEKYGLSGERDEHGNCSGTGSIEITSKPFNCRNGTCTSDLNKGDWQFVRDNYLIYVEPRFDGFGDMHSAYWITELLGPYNSDYTLHASGIVDDRLYIRYFDKNNKMINEEQIHSCDYGGANSSFKNKTVNIPAGQKFRLYVYSWDGPVGWMCDQYGNNCSTKDTLILKLKK